MELKFGSAKLRAIEKEDCELLKLLMNSISVEKKTIGWNQPVSTLMQENWIESYQNSDTMMRWMIELKNGITLGMIMLKNIDWKNRVAEMSIKTNPYEKNRLAGDTKDASYAVIQYAFEELGLHRIDSLLLKYNTFSAKLNESLGFQLEGIQRSKIFKNGKWNDVCCYGFLAENYVHYNDGQAPWQIKERGINDD